MDVIRIKWTSALKTVSFSGWTPAEGTAVNFVGALDAEAVELILRRIVVSGVKNCTITALGGDTANLDSLSAQGKADYAALTSAGNTVILSPSAGLFSSVFIKVRNFARRLTR